jgi:hypothetical protein
MAANPYFVPPSMERVIPRAVVGLLIDPSFKMDHYCALAAVGSDLRATTAGSSEFVWSEVKTIGHLNTGSHMQVYNFVISQRFALAKKVDIVGSYFLDSDHPSHRTRSSVNFALLAIRSRL